MISFVCIEGPTASGKSQLALELAEALATEIISADSRQIYRFMDIGTAKVSPAARDRISHHLVDIINPDESYNAGAFVKDASEIISGLHAKQKLPIICGGTGLYIRSLIEGLFTLPELPVAIRLELKDRLINEGLDLLFKQLVELDPVFAAKISANDVQRVLRGLEIALGTGIPITEHWRQQAQSKSYKVFRILLNPPRDELYLRINSRMQKMLKDGLIQEIAGLFKLGFTESSPGLNSLGYKEFMPYFLEQATLDVCSSLAAQHHRNYAKRQTTWYRRCTFDLTLTSSQIKLSETVKKIEDSFY
ncbi:MAG: tRNA (adenosine(37)-N6)-dimethylallyltransferase MiaA [Candidatus Cloacimonas sp.]|jgi:tRNA dimethylallyltransferase|nr:tRNA (adenosine(37)-N6)-dimethylallyltransferase MiaA [Candidatus Cloacimonas sp.]